MTNRTTDRANVVGDAAVAGANDLGQKTVEGVENVAASTGLVNPVSARQSKQLSFSMPADDTLSQNGFYFLHKLHQKLN